MVIEKRKMCTVKPQRCEYLLASARVCDRFSHLRCIFFMYSIKRKWDWEIGFKLGVHIFEISQMKDFTMYIFDIAPVLCPQSIIILKFVCIFSPSRIAP